jgi:hypothetical protein
MTDLPPPDPNETRGTPGLRLQAPAVIFLKHAPTREADRLADAILAARPGALIIAPPPS